MALPEEELTEIVVDDEGGGDGEIKVDFDRHYEESELNKYICPFEALKQHTHRDLYKRFENDIFEIANIGAPMVSLWHNLEKHKTQISELQPWGVEFTVIGGRCTITKIKPRGQFDDAGAKIKWILAKIEIKLDPEDPKKLETIVSLPQMVSILRKGLKNEFDIDLYFLPNFEKGDCQWLYLRRKSVSRIFQMLGMQMDPNFIEKIVGTKEELSLKCNELMTYLAKTNVHELIVEYGTVKGFFDDYKFDFVGMGIYHGFLVMGATWSGNKILIPKLHNPRCIMDLTNGFPTPITKSTGKRSKGNAKKIRRAKRNGYKLRVKRGLDYSLLCKVRNWTYTHKPGDNWLREWLMNLWRYTDENIEFPNIKFWSIEMVQEIDGIEGPVIAADIGWTTGQIYTSSSGGYDKNFPSAGKTSLLLLGDYLCSKNIKTWDFGMYHIGMKYKLDLGAYPEPREIWMKSVYKYRDLSSDITTSEVITNGSVLIKEQDLAKKFGWGFVANIRFHSKHPIEIDEFGHRFYKLPLVQKEENEEQIKK